jgi:hypothetical protein
MRLLLFSALERHELADMFLASMAIRDPMAAYMERQMNEGSSGGLIRTLHHALSLECSCATFRCRDFRSKQTREFDRTEVVKTFVSIFLAGMKRS